jgi:hypothetical protein
MMFILIVQNLIWNRLYYRLHKKRQNLTKFEGALFTYRDLKLSFFSIELYTIYFRLRFYKIEVYIIVYMYVFFLDFLKNLKYVF